MREGEIAFTYEEDAVGGVERDGRGGDSGGTWLGRFFHGLDGSLRNAAGRTHLFAFAHWDAVLCVSTEVVDVVEQGGVCLPHSRAKCSNYLCTTPYSVKSKPFF